MIDLLEIFYHNSIASINLILEVIAILTQFIKPFHVFFSKKSEGNDQSYAKNFPKKTLPKMQVYPVENKKKPVASELLY